MKSYERFRGGEVIARSFSCNSILMKLNNNIDNNNNKKNPSQSLEFLWILSEIRTFPDSSFCRLRRSLGQRVHFMDRDGQRVKPTVLVTVVAPLMFVSFSIKGGGGYLSMPDSHRENSGEIGCFRKYVFIYLDRFLVWRTWVNKSQPLFLRSL